MYLYYNIKSYYNTCLLNTILNHMHYILTCPGILKITHLDKGLRLELAPVFFIVSFIISFQKGLKTFDTKTQGNVYYY